VSQDGGRGLVRSGGGQRLPALDSGQHRFPGRQPFTHPGQMRLQALFLVAESVKFLVAESVKDLAGAGEQLVDI
jgi:hypothetical protein